MASTFALKANSQKDMYLYILVVIAAYLAFFRRKNDSLE